MDQNEIDELAESFRKMGLTWNQTNFATSVVRNSVEAESARLRADLAQVTWERNEARAGYAQLVVSAAQETHRLRADLAASQAECERLRGALNDLGITPEEARAGLERSRANKRDAERYRLVRRGQHWSVINGIGDELRAEALDAAIDEARAGKGE